MSTINWIEVRGQKFTMEEANEASNFHETLINFDIEPDKIVPLFLKETLTTAKRLVLAETVPLNDATSMVYLMKETDHRIIAVINSRIQEEEDTRHVNGDIIC